jgi:DNA-directed RNA polymerase specialized sigma24 family protein
MDSGETNQTRQAPLSLPLEEVRQELERIVTDPAGLSRLQTISRTVAKNVGLMDAEDLLYEALVQLMSGERRWPAGLDPLQILTMVMRSIASNARTKRDYELAADLVPAEVDGEAVVDSIAALGARASTALTPERCHDGQSELQEVENLVRGDEALELLLEAWADGLRGREVMDALGWDSKTYDANRKRLERRLKTWAAGSGE